MMPPIYQTLVGSSPVAAIIDDRAYRHGDAPQGVGKPYVTFYCLSAPENTLSELPGIDRVSVTVDCWSLDDSQVEVLADAVRDAIEPLAHCVGQLNDNRNRPNTNLYRVTLQFDWWNPRST